MQVILREDVPSLGRAGEVIKVADGFGRNFLLPQKKAIPATDANLKRQEQEKKSIELRQEKTRKESEALAEKLKSLKVSLEKQAGEEDKIFGSVSTHEIAKNLGSQGVSIDKRQIRLRSPIRQIGVHSVEVHLHADLVVPLQVEVIKK